MVFRANTLVLLENTVVFGANELVFEANSVVFVANTVVIGGKIQWYLGENTGVCMTNSVVV